MKLCVHSRSPIALSWGALPPIRSVAASDPRRAERYCELRLVHVRDLVCLLLMRIRLRPAPSLWKKSSSTNQSLVPERLGTAAVIKGHRLGSLENSRNPFPRSRAEACGESGAGWRLLQGGPLPAPASGSVACGCLPASVPSHCVRSLTEDAGGWARDPFHLNLHLNRIFRDPFPNVTLTGAMKRS